MMSVCMSTLAVESLRHYPASPLERFGSRAKARDGTMVEGVLFNVPRLSARFLLVPGRQFLSFHVSRRGAA